MGQGPQEPRFSSRCEREKRKQHGWGVGTQGAGLTLLRREPSSGLD